ncbi:hypothetical protein DV736_g4551, partial [Chaetothyriales sp. CBS 134916]
MKIAIAGPGDVARYVIPALLSDNHSVIVLTRSSKDWITNLPSSTGTRTGTVTPVPQLITDYTSVPQLTQYLDEHGVQVLISTLAIYDASNVSIHLALLSACTASATCHRFIPSEFGGNIREHPDQPVLFYENHEPIRQALRQQSAVSFTLVCAGWFLEYLLPVGHKERMLPEAGEAWAMDIDQKVMRIYGNGEQKVCLLSARDLGAALAKLVETTEDWEEYTFLSGEQLSWNELFDKIKARDEKWTKKPVSLAQSVRRLLEGVKKGGAEGQWESLIGTFEVLGHSEAVALPPEDLQRQSEKFFKGLEWKGVDEVLDEGEKSA